MSREKVVIIGSGPAGHTAGIYAWRALLEPLMFEWFMAWGVAAWGQLTTTTEVENYPGFPTGISGPELMDNMRKQSLHSGVRIETKTVDKVDLSVRPFKVFSGSMEVETDTIVIATGATAKRLGLPGEKEYRQRWISACAVCDGALPLFRDKHLIVIGGGDSACEEAHFLTKFASKVTMLVRRDAMRASKVMQERVLKHEKIEVLRNTEWKEILWDGKLMNALVVVNNKTNEEQTLEAGGLFYAIGHTPNTAFLGGQLKTDEAWYLLTKPGTTHVYGLDGQVLEGVFAWGDVQDRVYRQAITSAGTWCMAALEAEHYLQTLEE